MNSESTNTTKVRAMKSLLREIKGHFYAWCGLLSIDEIVSNPNLIRVIERLERLLLEANA